MNKSLQSRPKLYKFLVKYFLTGLLSVVTSLSAFSAPTNDACSGAIAYTINGQCRSIVFDPTVTQTGPASGGCSYTAEKDLWYSFTVSSTVCYSFALQRKLGSANYKFELYTGCPASAVNYLAGSQVCFLNSCPYKAFTNTLTAGTYYVRVSTTDAALSTANSVDLCISYDVAVNDVCSGATPLPNGTTLVSTFTAGCAYTSSPTDPTTTCKSGTGVPAIGASAWFKFFYSGSGTLTFRISNATCSGGSSRNGVAVCIYRGPCNSLTYLGSYASIASFPCLSGTNSAQVSVNPASTSYEYYAYVVGLDNSNCNFSVSLTNAAPLPIELLGFAGKKTDNKIVLNWSTATEINNDYFTILRSSNGEMLEEAGIVKGSGNSYSPVNYTFVDENPYQGVVNYYLLRQTDYDGTYKETKLIAISPDESEKLSFIYLLPDHESSSFSYFISNPEKKDLTFDVVDLNGKTVASLPLTSESGILSVPSLSGGIYIASVSDGYTKVMRKFIY